MKRLPVLLGILITSIFFANSSRADNRLTVGFSLEPTRINDTAYEFFSADNLAMGSGGIDVRVLAWGKDNWLQIVPLVAYRHARDLGSPGLLSSNMETSLRVHDLFAGLRLRGWIQPWMGVFAEVRGGAAFLRMQGTIDDLSQDGMLDRYTDNKTKWLMGALLGAEFRISPAFMEKRKASHFNFGGEVGMGFVKRGTTNFYPTLEGGDDNSIDPIQTHNFGDINLSGWVFHVGLNLHFI